MDLFAINMEQHVVNRQLINGTFPDEKLLAVETCEEQKALNIKELSTEAALFFKEDQAFLAELLSLSAEQFNSLRSLNNEQLLGQALFSNINFVINTNYCFGSLSRTTELYELAIKTKPFVTEIDSAVYFLLFSCAQSAISNVPIYDEQGREKYGKTWFFFFLNLLNEIEEKEYETKRTVIIDCLLETENILNLLQSDWTHNDKSFFRDLNPDEAKAIDDLCKKRQSITQLVSDEVKIEANIATDTREEWSIFVELLNDFADKERDTIHELLSDISRKEKQSAIQKYVNYVVNEAGLEKHRIDFRTLLERIKTRFIQAPSFCCVKTTTDNKAFILNDASWFLLNDPVSFNYLLMMYHQFRLDRTSENARFFLDLASYCINKNLNIDYSDDDTDLGIEELATIFLETVQKFIEENSDIINSVSFKEIQSEGISAFGFSMESIFQDAYIEWLNKEMNSFAETINSVDLSSIDDFEEYLSNEKEEYNQFFAKNIEKGIVRQFVVSLSIVYLVIDTLRMVCIEDSIRKEINDVAGLNSIRYKLERIEGRYVNTVYSEINYDEMGISEYWEKRGINAQSLSDLEEKYNDAIAFEVFQEKIIEIIDKIIGNSTESVFEAVKQIKEEIRLLPNRYNIEGCDTFLDSINSNYNEKLIENSYSNTSFRDVKKSIIRIIGDNSSILSNKTINTLTTAECLFLQYANDEYADSGFDYSCVSSLYYQAFEEAYNHLIWSGYAQFLNNLKINGKSYTTILEDNNGTWLNEPNANGYLFPDYDHRRNYLKKNNNRISVSLTCMYGHFAYILGSIFHGNRLFNFSSYLADVIGFGNSDNMFSDIQFMNKLESFYNDVKSSVDNRNNASHGGSVISLDQCVYDKRAVINEMRSIREENIGLIQQLVSLFTVAL